MMYILMYTLQNKFGVCRDTKIHANAYQCNMSMSMYYVKGICSMQMKPVSHIFSFCWCGIKVGATDLDRKRDNV